MTLSEYFNEFEERITGRLGSGFPSHIAAEIAAAHSIGLSLDQLQEFLARRTEITSVAVALTGSTLSADQISRIFEARKAGAVYTKEVLAAAFAREEIREKFHHDL
jgi:hypothetical protein